MAGELLNLRLRQIVAELRKLDRLLEERQMQRHVAFMRTVAKNFDAREMLRLSNELQIEVRSLELHLSGLIGEGRSYAAAAGNRPPQELSPGPFSVSVGGDIAEFRALSSKMSHRLDALAKELSAFKIESNSALNDPGRYGDAAISSPVNDIFSFTQGILDMIRRIKRL